MFLGLYFVLGSVANTVVSIYFYWLSAQITESPRGSLDPMAMAETYKHALTLIVGFFVMIRAGRLSGLLVGKSSSR